MTNGVPLDEAHFDDSQGGRRRELLVLDQDGRAIRVTVPATWSKTEIAEAIDGWTIVLEVAHY